MGDQLELRGLTYFSIAKAVSLAQDSGGILLPLTAVDTAGGRQLTQFPADTFEEGLLNARASLRELVSPLRVVIIWDGYLTLRGERSEAILAEAYGAGERYGLQFAQPYERTDTSDRVVEPYGNLKLLSETIAPLF